MNTALTVILVILIIAVIVLGLLYYFGTKMQARQVEQQKLMESMTQTATMLIIDKKKMNLKEAPLPKQVYEGTPWYLRWQKVPVVKAKVGPKIVTLLAEPGVFKHLPLKSEVKVKISGLYISEIVKGAVFDEKEIKKRQKEKEKEAKKAAKKK